MNERADKLDQDIYNFNISGIGDSWLIGTDNDTREDWNYANAFKNGISDCPENLTIPSTLTYNGEMKLVEVIGSYAFYACADTDKKGKTKRITLNKQVKVIKFRGLGWMANLEEFILEDGSVLETIEENGMYAMGFEYVSYDKGNRTTLTLPSTLSSVFRDGISICNLFDVIIYCGSHYLSNASTLQFGETKDTVVKVSSQYPSGQKIFDQVPDRNSIDEVEEKCSLMDIGFQTAPLGSESEVVITGYGNKTDLWCPDFLIIPEKINGSTVVAINESAFANCESKGLISLPSTLKKVGASAFANTSFVTAVFSKSTELEVGEAAFQNCGSGNQQPINVSLPQNIQLNKNAFYGAKIGEVYVM